MKNMNIFMVGIILSLFNPGILSSQSTLTPTSSFLGTHEYERVGYHLHTAGDVNGDGYDDFLVGTFHNDTKGYDAGAAYLFLGSKSADWGHDISLLNSDARFLGAKHYESAGYFLGGGGDVNGDGLDDMLIGAADGYLYIVFGRTAADWGMDFVLYDDADAWYEEEGDEDQAGISNAIIGDMNGDGYDDIICGAPFNDYGGGDAGKAYIILGKATGWHQGVKLNKSDASFYRSYGGGTFGYCVDGVGDVNGDDIPDFAIGARNEGKVYLFFGRTNVNWGQNRDANSADVIFATEQHGNYTGWRVSGTGDVNGDGYDDFLIGAPYHDESDDENGKVYLILGRSSGWHTNLSEADASYIGEAYDDEAGWDTQGAGDVDGDGYNDFLIGAWYNDSNGDDSGKMYLIRGKPSGWQKDVLLTSIEDYFIGEHAGDYAGYSCSNAGDVNGDGLSDIITSAPYYSEVYDWGGKIYIFVSENETITVSSPNGGETWEAGTTHDILWSSENISGNVKIEYSTDNGTNWTAIETSTKNDGSYAWTVPDDPATECLVRIMDLDDVPFDVSDDVFTISEPITYDTYGAVTYYIDTRPVPDALLDLYHSDGNSTDTTDVNGAYFFDNINAGYVALTPTKDGDQGDAITGSDALLMLQYLAFLVELTPDQHFASDVTEDGNVTGSDAQAILRYLAFYADNIGATGQWRFEPSDTLFELTENTSKNFKSFLLGDANGNWSESNESNNYFILLPRSESNSESALTIGETIAFDQKEIEIPIKVKNISSPIQTFMLTLDYDPACLNFLSVEKTDLSKNFMIVANGNEPGKIHIAMAGVKGIAIEGEILRILVGMKHQADQSQCTEVNIERALVNDLKARNCFNGRIYFREAETPTLPDKLKLSQNYPNPFNPTTTISFDLPFNAKVKITIFNTVGQQIATILDNVLQAGNQRISWNAFDPWGNVLPSGVYLYQIEIQDHSIENQHSIVITKKMVLIQ